MRIIFVCLIFILNVFSVKAESLPNCKWDNRSGTPCVNITKSGINVKYIIQRLVQVKEKLGIISDPAISNLKGFLLPARDLDDMFH